MLTLSVAAALAVVAGATGTWSPCGLSMISTLGTPRSGRGRWLVLVSGAAFTAGALAGGLVTFGGLSLAGAALGGDAYVVAAIVALAAALAELRGVRIVPQIRRQVPETWRWWMPLPVVSVLYGALLGLGFTTFVLTFGVWALAAISVAMGDPALGAAIGLAFGAGRAAPVVALSAPPAPWVRTALDTMRGGPEPLRIARRCNGAVLVALAAVLALGAARSAAAQTVTPPAPDTGATTIAGWAPSASAITLGWIAPDGTARLSGVPDPLGPADAIAVGPGGLVAVASGRVVTVTAPGAAPVSLHVQGVPDAMAMSETHLVWRLRTPRRGDALWAMRLPAPHTPRMVVRTGAAAGLGSPGVSGDRLVYSTTSARGSRVVLTNLATLRSSTVRRERSAQLRDPVLAGRTLLFVRHTYCDQRLVAARILPVRSRERVLMRIGPTTRRDAGHEHRRTTQGREAGMCPPAPAPAPTRRLLTSPVVAADGVHVALEVPGAPALGVIRATGRR